MERKKMERSLQAVVKKDWSVKSKRASITTGPLLTNPLNSCTKLQICTTLQNYFFEL